MTVLLALFFVFIGGFVGVMAMALAAAAKDADDREHAYWRGVRAGVHMDSDEAVLFGLDIDPREYQ